MHLFLSALIVFFLWGCSSPSDPVARGRARFVGLGCLTCHRVGDRGGGQAGPDLTTVGLRHSTEWLDLWMKDPQEWKPDTRMPRYKLTESNRAELVAYMATLQGEDYRRDPPWNSRRFQGQPEKRGENIYNRLGCGVCHGPYGGGGVRNTNVVGLEIPSLTMVRDGFTRDELKERIALGRQPEPEDPLKPPPMFLMPAWGDLLKEDEMEDLITYLYSLRPPIKPGDVWDE
ncbi:MAG: cytochrome c [Elusimicrobia bacterium]|nr:cytochrome c [Elusimicrobiota bacterium]